MLDPLRNTGVICKDSNSPEIILRVKVCLATKIVRKDSPGLSVQLPDSRGEVAGGLGDLPDSPGGGEVVPDVPG